MVLARVFKGRRRLFCASAAAIEALESRTLLASVTVNAGTTLRNVDMKWLAVNTAPWDGQMSSATTNTMANAINLSAVRMGGGSYVDDTWHFNLNNQSQTMGQQANFIANRNAVGMATINYGSGSPQEGAALLAYLNGNPSSTLSIGLGEQWSTASNSWVDVDWKTEGYWASLRASPTIGGNPDGLNFLRLNRPASFNIHYWDIGNEVYGSWEVDHHGHASDHLPMPVGGVRAPHDPTTIVSFAKQFQTLGLQIDPTISVGFDSQNTDPTQFGNWVANVLTQANAAHQNWQLGFVSDHYYAQDPGGENDTTLLGLPSGLSNPGNPKGFVPRATKYRTIINNNYGVAAGASVELMCTELNSVSSNPGKQVNSLVNAVFLADAVATMTQTEYNGAFMWDLHNSLTNGNASTNLYGWRTQGDYGLIGSGGIAPQGGLNTPFPNYFAEQMLSKIIKSGGTVVQATSNDTSLGAYAVKQSNGHLMLMVINRSKSGLNNDTTGTPALNATTFTVNGFKPAASGTQQWRYSSVEDNAAKVNGQTALTLTSPTLTIAGNQFSMSFPSLSMTVLDLTPAAPAVVTTQFDYETFPNRVRFTFDQDLLVSSLAPSDLVCSTLDGVAAPSAQSVSYDAGTRTVTFLLSNANFADANFTATLPAGSVSSASGVATTVASSFDFFSLVADANHDRHVDEIDQAILTAHLGQAGQTYSTGDFDGSLTVDAADQAILDAAFHMWLPADGAVSLPSTGGPDVFTIRRENNFLFDLYNGATATGTPTLRAYLRPILTSLTLDGGNGDDTLYLDYGLGEMFNAHGITFIGGSGTDTLAIVGTSNIQDLTDFHDGVVATNQGFAVSTAGAERVTFDGRGGDNILGSDVLIVGAGQSVSLPVSQELDFSIATNATLSMDANPAGVIVTKSMSIEPTGTLNLNTNSLIFEYDVNSPLSMIQSLINLARDGGTWTGTGISSLAAKNASPRNTTLAAIESAEFKSTYGPSAPFAGEPIDDTAVLVKYTYYGDVDFNGVVDFDDYSRVDAGFNNNRTGWLNGDVDGNGIVDFDDYSLIDQAFNTQGSALRPAASTLPKSVGSKLARGGRST